MSKEEEKQKALDALKKVIEEHIDVHDAFMCQLGSICLLYGKVGDLEKGFKGGSGVCHIIAKRDWEHKLNPEKFHLTGQQLVVKLMDVIVYGSISKIIKSKQTVHLTKDGYEAVISQNWNGDSVNWLLTGYKVVE